jgi:hypothetical protein
LAVCDFFCAVSQENHSPLCSWHYGKTILEIFFSGWRRNFFSISEISSKSALFWRSFLRFSHTSFSTHTRLLSDSLGRLVVLFYTTKRPICRFITFLNSEIRPVKVREKRIFSKSGQNQPKSRFSHCPFSVQKRATNLLFSRLVVLFYTTKRPIYRLTTFLYLEIWPVKISKNCIFFVVAKSAKISIFAESVLRPEGCYEPLTLAFGSTILYYQTPNL